MPKRTVGLPKANWQDEDVVELLAWLDYTLRYQLSFEDTIVGRLKGSCNKEYTYQQVKTKLWYLWRVRGGDNARDRDEIFTKGSSCLEHLNNEEKDDVATALERLEGLPIGRPPHGRRCLRSTSSTDNRRSECHIGPGTPEPVTPRQQRQQRREFTAQKRKRELFESKLNNGAGTKKTAREAGIPLSIESSPQKTQKLGDLDTGVLCQRKVPIVKESEKFSSGEEYGGDRDGRLGESEGEEETIQLRVDNNVRRPQEGPIGPEKARERGRRAEKEAMQARIKDLENQNKDLENQNKDLQEQNKGLQDQNKGLQDQMSDLKSTQTQLHNAGDRSINDIISEKDRRISYLNKILKERRELGTFTTSSGTHLTRYSVESIGQEVMQIGSEVNQILHAHNDDQPLKVPKIEQQSTFGSLIYQAIGLDPLESAGVERLTLRLAELSPQSVIRVLTESALCEWVFESSFPNFAREVPPLWAKYREHLTTQDGAIALRNIDLASHNSLINDPQFRELTVHKKAERLATRLSKKLAPFFPRNSTDSEQNAFETWGQEKCLWEERRARFIRIFEFSLKLKADSLLNTMDYEMVLYTPGTTFDGSVMEVETMQGAQADPPDGEGRKVDLCVRASLQAYARKALVESDEMSKAVVRYKNFVRKQEGQRSGAIVLNKAIVILKDEPTTGSTSDTSFQ